MQDVVTSVDSGVFNGHMDMARVKLSPVGGWAGNCGWRPGLSVANVAVNMPVDQHGVQATGAVFLYVLNVGADLINGLIELCILLTGFLTLWRSTSSMVV